MNSEARSQAAEGRIEGAERARAWRKSMWLVASLALVPPASAQALGPTVHTALGGFILGYDVDRDGTEGFLCEALTLPNGSSILVYDLHGNCVKSIDGLDLPSSPVRIALNPRLRIGFVLQAQNVGALQSFTY